MLLAITTASILLWAIYILLWSGCIFGALTIFSFADIKLPWRNFPVKILGILTAITFVVSITGILLFEEKLLIQTTSGDWKFGENYQNELRINSTKRTFIITESNGKVTKGNTTELKKSDTQEDDYFYLYILGYPNEMSSMMIKFQPLHSPKIQYKEQLLPCK